MKRLSPSVYRQRAREFLEAHPECEIRWDPRCERWATEVDHVAARSVRPDLVDDPSNWQATCGPCHRQKHANPVEARRRGVTRASWETA